MRCIAEISRTELPEGLEQTAFLKEKKKELEKSKDFSVTVLEQFLEKITDILSGLSGDRRLEIVNRVRQIIEKEYSEPLTMEYLAEKVYMSPNYLRTLFKDYTGETILEYITRIRMERSVVLLKETNMRVNDISKKVGYENPSHYCAVFRKQMGVTPNQFRSKLTGKGAL